MVGGQGPGIGGSVKLWICEGDGKGAEPKLGSEDREQGPGDSEEQMRDKEALGTKHHVGPPLIPNP